MHELSDRAFEEAMGLPVPAHDALTQDKFTTITSYAAFCQGEGWPAYPMEVFLEVSNVCNLKCAMCWQFSALNTNRFRQLKSQDRGFLATDRVGVNLDGILSGALLVHCFGFGEPTTHPEFRAIVEQVSAHGAMCDFYTNGMNLDQTMCEFLVDRRVLQIIVSFSGSTREFYENVYIGGDFARVLGGIRRLAEVKRARGSIYPTIHINSIGFAGHVATFDRFVEMMAAAGAECIILSHLSVHAHMPYLHEHVSDPGPEEEAAVLDRARRAAARLGVRINAAGYEKHAVASDQEQASRRARRARSVQAVLGAQGRRFGDNPVESFQQIARDLPVAREVPVGWAAPPGQLAPDAAPVAVQRTLGIRPFVDATNPFGSEKDFFYCMEPFKTLYVTRNGSTKPCSEADTPVFFGNLAERAATDIWAGNGYDGVRGGIARRQYPTMCLNCLKNRSAPEYYVGSLVDRYVAWNETVFGPGLRAALTERAPHAQRIIRDTQPETIMAHARARLAEGIRL